VSDSDPKLESLIADLPPRTAPAGWQARVLAAIDEPAKRSRRPVLVVSGVLAMAAAVVIFVASRSHPDVIEIELRHGAEVVRDLDPVVGDTLIVHGRNAVEVRAYRDVGSVIARCPGDAACRDASTLELALHSIGTIHIFAFYDHVPPAPGKSQDEDLAAAATAGSRIVRNRPITVR
jgi:hypothetical protein